MIGFRFRFRFQMLSTINGALTGEHDFWCGLGLLSSFFGKDVHFDDGLELVWNWFAFFSFLFLFLFPLSPFFFFLDLFIFASFFPPYDH